MGSALISVIIPVYNTAPYLDACLTSVTGQSYHNLEILLIDDCSTDGSAAILDTWAEKDSRIRVIHKEQNRGVSDSRNCGLRAASGEYITFVDSDDWLKPMCYEHMLAVMEQSGADIVVAGYQRVQSEQVIEIRVNKPTGTVEPAAQAVSALMPQKGHGRYNLYVWDKLFRKESISQNGSPILFDEKHFFCEDVLWVIHVLLHCRKVVYWDGVDYCYRQDRPGNASYMIDVAKDIRCFQDAVKTNEEIYQLLLAAENPAVNNALQRVILYQRDALRAAREKQDMGAFRGLRKDYVRRVFRWLRNNGLHGCIWGFRELAAYFLILAGIRF